MQLAPPPYYQSHQRPETPNHSTSPTTTPADYRDAVGSSPGAGEPPDNRRLPKRNVLDPELMGRQDRAQCLMHGTTTEGALLARPDGFVAWRIPAAEPDPGTLLCDIVTALLRRP
ncbi:hypothetical protein GCM10010353_68240 [Streptomyces chryseus]|nr:hypothetical protein GCM10010353_68240 [Streptomyces chryseus]